MIAVTITAFETFLKKIYFALTFLENQAKFLNCTFSDFLRYYIHIFADAKIGDSQSRELSRTYFESVKRGQNLYYVVVVFMSLAPYFKYLVKKILT